MNSYDAIVVGVGGVGSAALYHLARRGLKVLGIDRFPPGHARGSSHGDTRVIRRAYFEHPNYVPLLDRAYQNWRELETLCGQSLLAQVGLLEIGPPQGILIPGVRRASQAYALPLQELSGHEVSDRFPGFIMPDDAVAIFEPEGGYLFVEECIRNYVQQALALGAEIEIGTAVTSWISSDSSVSVDCAGTIFQSDRLIIAPGAWAPDLLSELGIRFRILRKHLHWYALNDRLAYDSRQGSPVFFYETQAGCYYGFPSLDQQSLKVAEHSWGDEIVDPLAVDRGRDPRESLRVEAFVSQHLSLVETRETRHEVCMYTMTEDEHFVVDIHPEFNNVCFAVGLSGHGFKFASVLGEILAGLAIDKRCALPIEFLNSRRNLGRNCKGFKSKS